MDITSWLEIKNIDKACVEGTTRFIDITGLIYLAVVIMTMVYIMKNLLEYSLAYRPVRKRSHLFFWH